MMYLRKCSNNLTRYKYFASSTFIIMISSNMFKHDITSFFIFNEFEFVDDFITSSLLNETYNILEQFFQIVNVFIKQQNYIVIIKNVKNNRANVKT